MLSQRRAHALLGAFLLVSLAAGVVHAVHYAFLTDDAYISFRYARNLADGHGLVFNPGFERVEGYTNFLWVALLSAARVIGIRIESAAHALSALASLGLWAGVVGLAWRTRLPAAPAAAVAIAPLLMSATRSVAVWSTSGLETRLFECLVVLAVLRLIVEDEQLRRDRVPRAWASLLFAAATLTRPDGLLLFGCANAALLVLRRRSFRVRLPWLLRSGAGFGAAVGAHYVFRYLYYGDWLPNTYYAKVGGSSWWEAGLRYLGSFALEYAAYLWLPLIALGVIASIRRGAAAVPLLYGAVVLPHALYIASIGGDHFEYRPLDLYFPFCFLLVGTGAQRLLERRRGILPAVAMLAAIGIGLVELPRQSHRQFPEHYRDGFPGLRKGPDFLAPAESAVYSLPGLRSLAAAHRDLVRWTTERYIGIRQEEHVLFLAKARREGERLRDLVEIGLLPEDTHIATDSVGAIAYFSRLRTLDRLGLTDRVVARGAWARRELMAHGKRASFEYAREIAVDLWAFDNVHLFGNPAQPAVIARLIAFYDRGYEVFSAQLPLAEPLIVLAPGGATGLRERFPRLRFERLATPGAIRRLAGDLPPGARTRVLRILEGVVAGKRSGGAN